MMVTSKKLLEKYHRRSKFVKNLIFFPENFVQKISIRCKKNLLYFNTRVILLHYENFNISSTSINNHYKESSIKSPYINPYMHRTTKHRVSLHVLLRLSLINKCKARWKHRLRSIQDLSRNPPKTTLDNGGNVIYNICLEGGGLSLQEAIVHYRFSLSLSLSLFLQKSEKKIPLLTSGHRGQVSIRS